MSTKSKTKGVISKNRITQKNAYSKEQEEKPLVPTIEEPEDKFAEKREVALKNLPPSKEEEFQQTKAIEVRGFAKPLVSVEEATQAFEQYQQLTQALMKTSDLVEVKGKTVIKKSGLNKVAKFFGISVEIIRVEKEYFVGPQGGRGFLWKVWAKAIAPNGQFRVAGAACSTKERMFAHQDHDVYAMAETRAKKRAIEELAGMGEYELEGDDQGWERDRSTPAPKTTPRASQVSKKVSPEPITEESQRRWLQNYLQQEMGDNAKHVMFDVDGEKLHVSQLSGAQINNLLKVLKNEGGEALGALVIIGGIEGEQVEEGGDESSEV